MKECMDMFMVVSEMKSKSSWFWTNNYKEKKALENLNEIRP